MKDKIEKTLVSLKDFQRKTVDYAIHQFDSGRNRLLIADEVGLGKTIVAKGIVARLFEKTVFDEQKTKFNVVYVCSNQAIAKANIGKLNFTEDISAITLSGEDDRVTSLAYSDSSDDTSRQFSLRAFTPATSFDDKTHAGRKDERVLLYRLLYDYADIAPYKNSLKWILMGNRRINEDTWDNAIKDAEKGNGRRIRGRVRSEFKAKLDREIEPETLPKSFLAAGITYPVKYWTLLKNLCQLEVRKNSYHTYDFGRELISHLRLTLSQSCITFLKADIFILDEFQRYKQLIETDPENVTPAVELARAIFSMDGVKVLMLSATPFKAYTTDFDEINGEVHHKEFETVLRFLNTGLNDKQWKEFNSKRSELFSFLRHFGDSIQEKRKAIELKVGLETFYRQCMVRTERLSVAKDKDTLVKTMHSEHLEPEGRDLDDFLALDNLTVYLNAQHGKHLPVPLEYVKSSPFALSFLEGYQHRKRLMEAVVLDANLRHMLTRSKHAWVDLNAIRNYKPLSKKLPNAKLRLLLNETVEKGAWKLLWVPPSMPYFDFSEPFAELSDFSKVLVFSSWVLVPRMISTLVSYEAERKSVGNPKSVSEKEVENREYFVKRRHPRPQILYRIEKEDAVESLSQPLNILYLYPSIFLTKVYDPERNLIDKRSLNEIRKYLKGIYANYLRSDKIRIYATGNGDWQSWFWAAPLILDKMSDDNALVRSWFEKGLPGADSVTDSEDETQQRDESSGKAKYFKKLSESFQSPENLNLPPLTTTQADKIAEYLATLTLSSPAVCYLRTQQRYVAETTTEMLDAAFEVSSAFVTCFNKPESIAVIRLCTADSEGTSYLDRVMEYSIAGNLQAMLDEYFHLIWEIEGLYSMKEIAEYISDVLSIRSSTTKIDDAASFIKAINSDEEVKTRAVRTHFAIDFAGQKLSTAKTSGRQINIRQAFNSPFKPFVLATTSIGQEGLDFHLYCRKIFHWNLPSNAIDIEQREGRINRYKGLVIRQNLLMKYFNQITLTNKQSAWAEIFQIAENKEGKGIGLCEMVPFWHTEPDPNLRIERYVPLYSFSRDIDKYNELLKVLVYYRITFGQPRQEELIMALSNGVKENRMDDIKDLLIDLSPMSFYHG
jgi:hypothetical protein